MVVFTFSLSHYNQTFETFPFLKNMCMHTVYICKYLYTVHVYKGSVYKVHVGKLLLKDLPDNLGSVFNHF